MIDGYKDNTENSLTAEVREHTPSDFSRSTILSFKSIENKNDVYKKLCRSFRKHAMKIINFKKKKMKLLTKEQQQSYQMRKSVIFVKKNLNINMWKMKNIVKIEIIVIIQGNIEVLRIAYIIPNVGCLEKFL